MGCAVTHPRDTLGADLNRGSQETLTFKPDMVLMGADFRHLEQAGEGRSIWGKGRDFITPESLK